MALLHRTIWSIIFPNGGMTTMSHHQLKASLIKRRDSFMFSRWKSGKYSDKARIKNPPAYDGDTLRFTSFEEMVESKRREARKSIVVQVQSVQSCPELYSYCSSFGSVTSMHHYALSGPSHYVIVEFAKETDVDNILHSSGHLDSTQIIPVRSPFLWFRIGREKRKKEPDLSNIPLIESNGDCGPSKNDLYKWMHTAVSVSDQIEILHNATKLTSLGSRLRFLTALQIEQALSGPFPRIKAYPFGSSVNGFGKLNCDLDLVLELDRKEASPDCRLIFHAKNSLTNGRTQLQRHMETIGDICQLFLPGCANVRRILQARIPIIKYRQELTGVECDLSMTNTSAIFMSELLFILGSVDKRVRPLVQAVRTWARDVGLTSPSPGRWITNFSLTLLVLFYLQQSLPHPILPTLNKMITMANPHERRITMEGVNCTFARDLDKLHKFMDSQPKNADNLEDLLLKFFEFYCKFDFGSNAISLGTGTAVPKPEHSALYIVNPLERGLNVSKNISLEEMERLRVEFRNAAWVLEANLRRPVDESELWGLVAICQAPQLLAKGQNVFYVPPKSTRFTRKFNVHELFSEDLNVKEKSSVERDLSVSDSNTERQDYEAQETSDMKGEAIPKSVIVDKEVLQPPHRRKR